MRGAESHSIYKDSAKRVIDLGTAAKVKVG